MKFWVKEDSTETPEPAPNLWSLEYTAEIIRQKFIKGQL